MWMLCLAHSLKHSSRARGMWDPFFFFFLMIIKIIIIKKIDDERNQLQSAEENECLHANFWERNVIMGGDQAES